MKTVMSLCASSTVVDWERNLEHTIKTLVSNAIDEEVDGKDPILRERLKAKVEGLITAEFGWMSREYNIDFSSNDYYEKYHTEHLFRWLLSTEQIRKRYLEISRDPNVCREFKVAYLRDYLDDTYEQLLNLVDIGLLIDLAQALELPEKKPPQQT